MQCTSIHFLRLCYCARAVWAHLGALFALEWKKKKWNVYACSKMTNSGRIFCSLSLTAQHINLFVFSTTFLCKRIVFLIISLILNCTKDTKEYKKKHSFYLAWGWCLYIMWVFGGVSSHAQCYAHFSCPVSIYYYFFFFRPKTFSFQ